MPPKKKKRNLTGWLRQLPVKARVNDLEFEGIAREAAEAGFQERNDYYLSRLVPRNLEKRVEYLRKKQRAAGMPDTDFLHHKRLREMGIKVKPGRRKKNVLAAA